MSAPPGRGARITKERDMGDVRDWSAESREGEEAA
jgi:hypothetical protein